MVDRCVCLNITFAELKRRRDEEGLDLAALIERTGCCTGCATCEPYVRLMIHTGRTRFQVLTPREASDAMRG